MTGVTVARLLDSVVGNVAQTTINVNINKEFSYLLLKDWGFHTRFIWGAVGILSGALVWLLDQLGLSKSLILHIANIIIISSIGLQIRFYNLYKNTVFFKPIEREE